MLNHSLRLGRIRGIEIDVNWTWLIIFILLTWSLAEYFFVPPTFPGWSTATRWLVGAISSLLLFVSVLVHELCHSLVAESEGIPVRSITLFVFGGVSDIESEPHSAKDEFLIAAAGPFASLVIGLVCYALLVALSGVASGPVRGTLIALAFYNVTLAIFNLIPGFPLDGGRIFRSIVWGITGSFREATTIAVGVGKFFAYLFIFGGLLLAIFGAFLSGIWLVFIGWFLNNAASASGQQSEIEYYLRGVRVATVMTRNPPRVPTSTSVANFIEHYVLGQNLRALPVVEAGTDCLAGLITLSDARTIPRPAWSTTTVDQAMVPMDKLTSATPDESLIQALQELGAHDLNQLPVIDQGRLVGMISRGDIFRYIQVQREIQRAA